VTVGVVLGLVVGKFVGITGAVSLATKLRVASLPAGLTLRHVAGVAALAGIGFTVSLFISGLAFDDPALDAEAKIGILVASVVAAVAGSLLVRSSLRPSEPQP
jgi:NhaA family Na+:H+ antiporter